MEHPGLHVRVFLFFNEGLVEETCAAIENIAVDFHFGIACESEAPDNVSGHPTITLTLFPPTPTAIRMLKIVEALEAGFRNFIELLQILFAVWMGCSGKASFNSSKNAAHNVLRLEAKITQSFCGDGRRKKPAHRLFSAAIRVINEIG